ncbi:ketopantoate reductase family protein [Aquihabitans sp. McL0605]|uniref:ketopantoate reductase family protein n=1 Tax=Aquihabitans sp. McL0605 TaxID=3415671 RepID=UPI003CFAA132
MSRFLVHGAGAIGGVVGGRLFQAGHDVVLMARGAHLDAIRHQGLRVECPTGVVTLPIPVVGHPDQIEPADGDVVLLTVKGQDSPAAIADLLATVDPATPVVSLQNGVENERLLLRTFEHVHGVCVMFPATHLEPGVVQARSSPVEGILDIGRYPAGADETTAAIAEAFRSAGFVSEVRDDIMRWKRRKLLLNLANAVDALCGFQGRGVDLYVQAVDEGVRCFAAAGLDVVSEADDAERRGELIQEQPIAGRSRRGGSGWQSLERGAGSIETDHLNGEIALLGRLHDVDTPVNALLQRLARQAARERRAPRSMAADDLFALLADGPA